MNEAQEKTLRETMDEAYEGLNKQEAADGDDTPKVVIEEPVEGQAQDAVEKSRDEQGKFKKQEAVEATPVEQPRKPPEFWPAARKEKFAKLTPDVQDMILERESEVEKGFTKMDEDRTFGKSMKEVVSPYMAIIQAEGGTPHGAVKDLLNTAYVLRTGSAQQKAQIVQQVMKQYGIDPQLVGQQQHGQPQQPAFDPTEFKNSIMNDLQEQQMRDKIDQELQAFTANAANVHFANPAVKEYMSSLLGSGKAKDYQDAYDQAIWLVPEIRTGLIAEQSKPQQQQRSQDIAAKKKAGSSVSGSPGISVPNSGNPNRSLREELKANMDALAQ